MEQLIGPSQADAARAALFQSGEAGKRCLLDDPVAREIAQSVRAALAAAGKLSDGAVAIQAIAFDKTPEAN